MAILVKTETNTGLSLKDGYFKINNITLDERGTLHFSGALYASKEARDSGKQPLERAYYMNYFVAEDKMGNLFKQAYEHITELAKTNEREKALFGEAKEI